MLCTDGAVKPSVELDTAARAPAWARSNVRRPEPRPDRRQRLRTVLAGPPPRFDGGRLVLAVAASPRLRSDAPCSAEHLFCHIYGRAKTASQFIPGRPHSFVAALELGPASRTRSWTRSGSDRPGGRRNRSHRRPERLIAAGQWQAGNPDIVVVSYDITRLAWDLRDLRVELVGRVRSDHVMRLPKPPRVYDPKGGRPPKHGPGFRFTKSDALRH
ncbi:transposase [Streptomyces sp. ATexAB-D23]|uniref:transposase n=1 Tax=unclassified Streptomyces TaxID=2593676 RepID=UPI001F477098|nr:transposase [Streptomyces sp. ATexAB-D23]